MSIPATVIYFVGYDQMKIYFIENVNDYFKPFAPVLVGALSRTIAAATISPLELYRTRLQSKPGMTHKLVYKGIISMVKSNEISSLWRGLYPTLYRDVPFSAIYWFNYEWIKALILDHYPKHDFTASFFSGAMAGSVAAAATTPFDVAKTRRQIEKGSHKLSVMKQVLIIYKEEGIKGMFSGLSARVLKVSPACAIMISSYEFGKRYFSN